MTLKKALVLNWAVKNESARSTLRRVLEGEGSLEDVLVRLDPALNRALDLARGEGLIHISRNTTGSVISLTAAGMQAAVELEDDRNCLLIEKAFFNSLKNRLPEKRIKELLNWETTE